MFLYAHYDLAADDAAGAGALVGLRSTGGGILMLSGNSRDSRKSLYASISFIASSMG